MACLRSGPLINDEIGSFEPIKLPFFLTLTRRIISFSFLPSFFLPSASYLFFSRTGLKLTQGAYSLQSMKKTRRRMQHSSLQILKYQLLFL